jgi:hypothetical protein
VKAQNLALLAITLSAAGLHSAAAESRLAWEQPPRVVEDRFRLEFSSFMPTLNTTARVDFSPDSPGTEFNAENDLGLAKSKFLFLPELTLLPGKRHLIRLSGFSLRRNGHKVIERNIEFDEDSFARGDVVDSTLDIDVVEIDYGYRLAKFDRFEADAILGIELLDITTNAVVRGTTTREPSGNIAPIPVVGLEARVDLTKRLALEFSGHYVSVTVDTTSGSITDLRGAITWRMNSRLVAGLGYRSFDLNAESTAEDSSGLVHLKMAGPVLFFRASL